MQPSETAAATPPAGAEIITYAQFLAFRARRAIDQAKAGDPVAAEFPWAYTFRPPHD